MAKTKKKCCDKVQKKGKCCKRCPLFEDIEAQIRENATKKSKKKQKKKKKKSKK